MKKYHIRNIRGAILPLAVAPMALTGMAVAQQKPAGRAKPAVTTKPAATAKPAATTSATASNAKAESINAGELRLDGKITGILGTGAWQVEAQSWTSPRGITTDFEDPKNKGVTVRAETLIHPRGETTSVPLKDVKLGTRVAVIGKNGPNGKLLAREVLLLEGYGKSKTIGQISTNPLTFALVKQSRDAREAGQLPKALNLIDKAIATARGLNDNSGEGLATQDKGLIYMDMEQYGPALTAFTRVAQIGRAQGNSLLTSLGLNGSASLQMRAGQPAKALELFREADTASANTETALRISILSNLAYAYLAAGQPREAIATLERVHPLEDAEGKDSDAAETMLAVAMMRASDDPNAARETLKTVAPRIERARDDKAKANLLGSVGLVKWRLGEKESAKTDFAGAATLAQGAGADDLAKKWREIPTRLAGAGTDFASFWNVVTGQKAAPATQPPPNDAPPQNG